MAPIASPLETVPGSMPPRWILLLAVFLAIGIPARSEIDILRLPDGGVQPRVAMGRDGTLHVVFLRGKPAASDVWYARRGPQATNWESVVRVNSRPGSAVAMGTVRGVQLGLRPNGFPAILWNGSGKAVGHSGMPLEFATQRAVATQREERGFTGEQDVIRHTGALDGGGSVAVGGADILAAWHGFPEAAEPNPASPSESQRGVFIAVSHNGGIDFEPDQRVDWVGDGACGCCGLQAAGRPDGGFAILYRRAREGMHRDAVLLMGSPDDHPWRRVVLDEWRLNSCPMSTAALAWAGEVWLAAWETREEIRLACVDPRTGDVTPVVSPRGQGHRKHPSLALRPDGGLLLVWVEDTGWNRGGSVAWQLYGRDLRPDGELGRREGVPVWGSAAAFAATGGRCGLVY